MDGMLVVNIFLLDLFLLFDCLLLHVGQDHNGVHQFVYGYGYGLVVGFVVGVRVATERLLGWGHLGWGNMLVVERGNLVGIVSMVFFQFGITLGWIV